MNEILKKPQGLLYFLYYMMSGWEKLRVPENSLSSDENHWCFDVVFHSLQR